MFEYRNLKIDWLGHDGFCLKSEKVLYFDPYEIKKEIPEDQKADIILITHSHYDHCSIKDIKKVMKDDSIIIAPIDCVSKLTDLDVDVKIAKVNEEQIINGIKILPVKAYNTNKQFHPMENEWVGYVVNVDGIRIYHAGDTDLISEMSDIKTDIALLPVSGTYVMTAEEAAEACKKINPDIAIPMYYGSIVGSKEDAERFKILVKDCDVYIF